MGQKIDKFNYHFDFIARVLKLLLLLLAFIIIVGIIMWPRYHIDWLKSAENLIENQTLLAISCVSKTSNTGTSEVVKLLPQTAYVNIYQNDQVVFTVDKPYDVSKKQLTIDKMIIKGKPNYEQSFLYAGAKIKIVHIKESIGLLISSSGVEGPVLRGVDCIVE